MGRAKLGKESARLFQSSETRECADAQSIALFGKDAARKARSVDRGGTESPFRFATNDRVPGGIEQALLLA